MRAPILPVHPDDIPKDAPELDDLRWSLTIALAERDEALWTLERVRDAILSLAASIGAGWPASELRDISDPLTPRADGGRDA